MKTIKFDSVSHFKEYYGATMVNPLVGTVRYTKKVPVEEMEVEFGIYAIFLKENKGCQLSYGRTQYDFDEMTILCFAPGQKLHIEPNPDVIAPRWTALVFHPDLLKNTPLGLNIGRYHFFDYSSSEALHLSRKEVQTFRLVVAMAAREINHEVDFLSRMLVVNQIELLLNYCLRFYNRQFVSREVINHTTVQRFEALLHDYLQQKSESDGLPSVAYFADLCNLTPGYFGELVKVETGKTAQDFIADKIYGRAQELLSDPEFSISQVSNKLGFAYPQHFVRFFKRMSGRTPSEFRGK